MGWTGRTVESCLWRIIPGIEDPVIDNCHDYTVYGHLTPSMKWYFGITKQPPRKRWRNGEGYKGSYFYNAVKKYGWNNIYHHIVGTGLTKEQACYLEKKLIEEYDTLNRDKGYNRTVGGDQGILGYKFTDEQKRRLSESHKGKSLSEEQKKKLRGRIPWNKGGHMTPESRAKMSIAQRNRPPISEETRAKLSAAHSGENHWNYGRHYSKEFRERLSDAHKGQPSHTRKQVLCIDDGLTYESAAAAEKAYGLGKDCVASVCRGDKATAGGRHFCYTGDAYVENRHHKRSKSVVCVETGVVYESAAAAAKAIGLSSNAVSNAAAGYCRTSGGYHWRYVE